MAYPSLTYTFFAFLFLFVTGPLYAQQVVLQEDFEDQDLSQNPEWTGDLNDFTFIEDAGNTMLRLNAPGAGSSQLRTISSTVYGTWEFFIDQDFPPSNNNRGFIFLISDREDLDGSVNGYAIRTGENSSPNFFRLFRFENGNAAEEIITGQLDISSGGPYQVRVTRDEDGTWEMYESEGHGSEPQLSGSAQDNTFTSSTHFGLQLNYTTTRSEHFFFDDIIIENSEEFDVVNADVVSANELDVLFNYPIDETSLQPIDFFANQGVGSPQSVSLESDFVVRLSFADTFDDGDYLLTINNVDNVFGGTIPPDTEVEFTVENPFEIVSVEAVQTDRIEVEFTEPPDEDDLLPANFDIVGEAVQVAQVDYDENTAPNTIFLELDGGLSVGDYTLAVNDLHSTAGWSLAGDTEIQFSVENPFFVTDFEILSRQEFDITFSQDVQAATVTPANFDISGAGSPNTAQLEDPDRIRITYSDPVDVGEQELIINNLVSTEGWEIEANTTLEFVLFDTYEEGDLVMSEFYYRVPIAWRTAEFDRPRYVEIFNRSGKFLNLRDFTLTGENISEDNDLPIGPGEFLVVTRGVPVFEEQFGERNFVEADNFPTLNLTTSSSIVFETDEGELIEQLTYVTSTWGGNEVSLERYSFDVSSEFRDNWAESEDVLTGSPGLPNTVTLPTDAPQVVEAAFPEPARLQITFSRTLSDESLDNLGNFSLDNNAVFTSVDFTDDERTIEFELQENLEDQFEYTFSYQNIEDIFGNEVSGTRQFNFTFINPFRILTAELENDTNLRVQFTLPLQVSTVQLSDFELSDGTSPINFEFVNSETVRLTFSDNFSVGSFTIVANNIESLADGWELEEDTSFEFFRFQEFAQGDIVINEFMYRPPDGYSRYVEIHNTSNKLLNLKDWELRRAEGASSNGGVFSEIDLAIQPAGFVVITPDEEPLQQIFGSRPWFEMSNFPGFTLTVSDRIRLLNPDGDLVEMVEYVPSTWGGNGVALERRSLDAPANDINNWGESLDDLLGTPGLPNSVGPDDEGPQLLSADFISADSVRVEFTGSLDGDAISSGNFDISGGLSVNSIEFDGPTSVNLILNNDMNSGTTYTVTATNISDIFGNVLGQASASFTFFFVEQAEPGDVFITEFMYNEPDDYTRYIEIHNASNKAFDIAGWQQANDTGTRRTLTNQRTFFPPNSYLVILPNEELFNIFPDIEYFVNAGGSLSALKNGGDEIVIVNGEGATLDSLRYSPDWGGNGVALERRRINRSPLFAENWGESPNELLGTPGRPNDIDSNFNLVAERIQSLSPTIVRVIFNADIRPDGAVPGNFAVNGTNPSSVEMDTTFAVLLEFSEQLNAGPRTLTVNNIRTLGGFQIAENSQFEFTVFDQFEEGDIVINEFMYRPPENYVRYVELFNASDKLLNLRDWRLQRRQVSTESRRAISTEDLAMEPGAYLVLTADAEALTDIFGERNYFEMASFPNLTATVDDQIRIFTDTDVLADSLNYSPSTWGGDGVALERISLDLPTELDANWAESPNPLLGTPGLPNEVSPDTDPPVWQTVEQFEDQGFILTFDKRLDTDSATNPANYVIDPSLSLSMIMLDQNQVTLLAGEELVNDQVYDITVSGISDLFGNEIEPVTRSIRYLEFGDVDPQQLVINEVLYRRLQAGSPEFVEIFNRSDINVDLSGWTLWDSSGSAEIPGGTAIRENDYVVFTDTQSFAAESEKTVYVPGFQSLSNNGDAVVLKNPNETVIDSLFYQPTWGNNEQGVSLERKDPSALSIDPANWAPSTDDRGSTPAEPNSRFEIDELAPEIVFANLFHPDSLEIRFTEFIDLDIGDNQSGQLSKSFGPQSDQGVQRESTRFLINGAETEILLYNPGSANRIVLDGSAVAVGEVNTISIENFSDFQGNVNTGRQQAIAQPISEGDLVINEIMFNPISDDRDGLPDQSEYVEIHNRRDYAISLEGIFLHDEPNDDNEITRIDPVSSQARWIPAGGYALFYPEPEPLPFEQSRTASFFELDEEFAPFTFRANRTTLSLPNAGRQVFLADSTLRTIDMVEYSESWHNPNIVDTRGIALERINPDFDSNNSSNWGSNTTVLGGSPGSENSIYQRPGQIAEGVGVTLSPNPFSPDGDGFEDNLFINYSLGEPDYLLRIRIYDRYGRLVRKLVDGEPAGFEGSVIWDGRTDGGQTNRIGIYIIFVEAYNSTNGSNRTFRETAVLARQF